MGSIMLWTQLFLYSVFMLDLTSGLQCLNCTGVKVAADCQQVITCANDSICHASWSSVFGTSGYGFSCLPRSQCPPYPRFWSGFGGFFSGCCDNGDLCVLHMPELFPPKVTHLDPPRIHGSTLLELHSTAYLSCYGNVSITVNTTWLYNGGSTLPPHAKDTFRADGSVLEIRNITRSDGGNYTCIIAKDGVTASTSVIVSVIEANSPIGTLILDANRPITNGKMVLILHDSTYIDCRSQRNDVTYAWQFNGNSVLPPDVNARSDSLHIGFMTGAAAGKYTCIVSKTSLSTSASVWVSVKEEEAHVLQVTTSPLQPWKSDQLDVICHVTGYPVPTIRWSFTDPMGENYMPPGSSNLYQNRVHIQNFQPSLHSGTWTCMARNSLGVDQKSIQI